MLPKQAYKGRALKARRVGHEDAMEVPRQEEALQS